MWPSMALVGTVVVRAARADRRTALLSVVLVAIPIVAAVVALIWTTDEAVLAIPVVAALVWVALAVGEPLRSAVNAHLWINGGRAGTRVLVVVAQAAFIGITGTVVGLVVGSAAVAGAVALFGALLPTPSQFGGVAVAGLIGTAVTGGIGAVRALRMPSLPALQGRSPLQKIRWWWLALCVALVALTIKAIPESASTFDNLQLSLLVFSPLLIVGTAGLSSAALRLTSLVGPRAAGPTWFALRSVGRDRRRTGPMAALIAVVVGICAIAAVFSVSFAEREVVARAEVQAGGRPAWVAPDATTPPDVESLGRSFLIMEDPRDQWFLAVVAVVFLVPAVGTAVALSASARRQDDELVMLQGADDRWTRWTNAAEAMIVTTTGMVVGLAVALGGVSYGFHVYNESTRLHATAGTGFNPGTDLVYPPVPFVVPWGVLLLLVVALPIASAGLAALLTPRHDAISLGYTAEASAPVAL